jgi:hypothetical protein
MAYTDTPNMPLHMPTPGTKEPAQISLLNENCVVLSNHDHTTGKGLAMGRLRSGLAANRPAAGSAGNVYFSTDTGIFNVDTGTAWVQFLTSGGQATVTGWTLIDPIIRDTLQFGPEGSGTIDASIIRTAANSFQVNNNVGLGVAPGAWRSDLRALQYGSAAAVMADSGPGIANYLLSNVLWGATRKAITNNPGAILQFDGTSGLLFLNAPAVAAGADQTFTTRMTLDPAGNMSLGGAPPAWRSDLKAIHLGGGGSVYGQLGNGNAYIGQNTYISAAGNYTSLYAAAASELSFTGGGMSFRTAPSVAAGATQTFTSRFTVDANGTLGVVAAGGQPIFVLNGNGQNRVVADGNGNIYPSVTAATNLGLGGNAWATVVTRNVQSDSNLYMRGTGSLICSMSQPYFNPESDAGQNLGYPNSGRWANLYIYYAPTIGSHADMKENFAPLDPTACVEAVLGTDWISYDYKQQPPPERREDEDDEAYQARLDEHQKMLADTDFSRHQKGYALGHPEYKVADLFGTSDRANRSDGADLGVIACALQDALRRLAALEARDGNAAAA